jgi:serine/threonine protein phosphatase PrpC
VTARYSSGRHAAEPTVSTSERYEVAELNIGEPGRAASTVVPRPDQVLPFRHDMVLDGVRIPGPSGGDVELRAASVRGLSHLYYGKVRQDEFSYLVTEDGRWLVAAIADGLSSGRYSHLAAEIVCQSGCRHLARQLADGGLTGLDWRALFDDLCERVLARAGEEFGLEDPQVDVVAGRMAATALFAVVDLAPTTGGRPAQIMALGDTSAWVLRPDDSVPWAPLQEVKNAGRAVASSSTAAVPAVPRTLAPPVVTELRAGDVLVLMSDGVGDPLGGGTGEVGEFLAEAWRTAPDPLTFAAQVGFRRRSYDDDRTVLAVWTSP